MCSMRVSCRSRFGRWSSEWLAAAIRRPLLRERFGVENMEKGGFIRRHRVPPSGYDLKAFALFA